MGPAHNVAIEVTQAAAPWLKEAPAIGSGEAAPSPDGQLAATPPLHEVYVRVQPQNIFTTICPAD